MVVNVSYNLYSYNTHNELDVKKNDAVKITLTTPNLLKESFWVEIIDILNDGQLLCTIQNKLNNLQPVNYLDEIIINKCHIKEHKEKNKRFVLTPEIINMHREGLNDFVRRFGRIPTLDEFMDIYNVRINEFNN